MMSTITAHPEGLAKVDTNPEGQKPVTISFDSSLYIYLNEAQADNLFAQLGQSAKKIEAARRTEQTFDALHP